MQGDLRRHVLPNGLRVLGVENQALHSFVCSLCVRVGPRFEPPEQLGLSHFLEHMLLQGSEGFPSSAAIMRGVEDLGGLVAASTCAEHLEVVFGVHRKHWRRVLRIAAGVVLQPLFEPGEIESEKSIIAQEIAAHRDMAGRNISSGEMGYCLLFAGRLREAGSRGSVQIMQSFDRDAVAEHYRRFFVPANMVLCIAGGLDFDEVLAEVAELFGGVAAPPQPPPDLLPPAERKSGGARAFYRTTEALPVTELLLSHRAFGLRDDQVHAARAAAQLLGGGLSSRLFLQVREQLGLVYDIQSHLQGYSDAGALEVSLRVRPENLVRAFEATLEVLQRLRREGFAAAELERHQESVRCGMDMLCDRPGHLTDWFGKQELLLGTDAVITPRQYVRRHDALTLDELDALIAHVTEPERTDLVCIGPYGEAERDGLRRAFAADEVTCDPSTAGEGP